ncbi:MAG: phospholipase D family protein [Pirellulales bacterium]|nr:phospholipase D family protein [Alphaproteobacteria bacterium]MDA7988663.1 phospholipase D family protein [Alphaproteobacteria bacterium]MDA8041573.1 phospholipase D family protein [Pirellulales bacterium]
MLDLLRGATGRIVIVAPYIKSPALRRLLAAVPDTVTERVCVTRWLPEDIASGVCDLEILDDIMRLNGGRLLVQPHLHAKYYSNGAQALVGSANLTARGLGWHSPSNVELLVTLSADAPGLPEWEKSLLDSSVEATAELREQIRARAEEIRQTTPKRHVPEVGASEEETAPWIPRCTVPDRLWKVYNGGGADTMPASAYDAAKEDLAALSPPPGLSETLFTECVAGILRQTPLFAEIDRLAETGLTDIKAKELLADFLGAGADGDSHEQAWRVMKDWLINFFPDTYRREATQEVLVKGRELSRRGGG